MNKSFHLEGPNLLHGKFLLLVHEASPESHQRGLEIVAPLKRGSQDVDPAFSLVQNPGLLPLLPCAQSCREQVSMGARGRVGQGQA